MDDRMQPLDLSVGEGALGLEVKRRPALDALDLIYRTLTNNIDGFGRPRRQCAEARNDEQHVTARLNWRMVGAIAENAFQANVLRRGKWPTKTQEMPMLCTNRNNAWNACPRLPQQAGKSKR